MRGNNKKKSKRITDPQLTRTLQINLRYSEILNKLAEVVYDQKRKPQKSRLFQTLQILKDLQKCLHTQRNSFKQYDKSPLWQFIEQKKMQNSGNLIGKIQELNDEIVYYKEQLQLQQVQKSNQASKIIDQQKQLEQQLEKLTSKRIQLQNKTQIISYQLQCGSEDLVKVQINNIKQQIKLREIEHKN